MLCRFQRHGERKSDENNSRPLGEEGIFSGACVIGTWGEIAHYVLKGILKDIRIFSNPMYFAVCIFVKLLEGEKVCTLET